MDRSLRMLRWVYVVVFIIWIVFCFRFVETQRWLQGHFPAVFPDCGPGYVNVYHSVHNTITCKLKGQ